MRNIVERENLNVFTKFLFFFKTPTICGFWMQFIPLPHIGSKPWFENIPVTDIWNSCTWVIFHFKLVKMKMVRWNLPNCKFFADLWRDSHEYSRRLCQNEKTRRKWVLIGYFLSTHKIKKSVIIKMFNSQEDKCRDTIVVSQTWREQNASKKKNTKNIWFKWFFANSNNL